VGPGKKPPGSSSPRRVLSLAPPMYSFFPHPKECPLVAFRDLAWDATEVSLPLLQLTGGHFHFTSVTRSYFYPVTANSDGYKVIIRFRKVNTFLLSPMRRFLRLTQPLDTVRIRNRLLGRAPSSHIDSPSFVWPRPLLHVLDSGMPLVLPPMASLIQFCFFHPTIRKEHLPCPLIGHSPLIEGIYIERRGCSALLLDEGRSRLSCRTTFLGFAVY